MQQAVSGATPLCAKVDFSVCAPAASLRVAPLQDLAAPVARLGRHLREVLELRGTSVGLRRARDGASRGALLLTVVK